MKNRILTLSMSALLVAPAFGAGLQPKNAGEILGKVQEKVESLAGQPVGQTVVAKLNEFGDYLLNNKETIQKTINTLFEQGGLVETVATKLAAGDFEGLKTYLKNYKHKDYLNFAPVITALRENVLAVKQLIPQALAAIDLNNWPLSALTDNVKATITDIKAKIQEKLPLLEDLKKELDKEDALYYANLYNNVKGETRATYELVIDELAKVAKTPEYKQLQQEIKGFYTHIKTNLVDKMRTMDYGAFNPAIANAADYWQDQSKGLDLMLIIPAIAQFKSVVAPLFESFKKGFLLGLKVEQVLGTKGLPDDMKNLIQVIKDNKEQIIKALDDAQTQATESLKIEL